MENILVDKVCLLEKFEGKGGWTYAQIPEIKPSTNNPFGWVKVSGSIDGFPISNFHLMPMGNGALFLSVKAEIRKSIKKKAGDFVHIILHTNNLAIEIPTELEDCLSAEPNALTRFKAYTNSEQKACIDWIYSAKTDKTKIDRIAKTINRLNLNKGFYDK